MRWRSRCLATVRSIFFRKRMNSLARWRGRHSPMTSPVFTSSAEQCRRAIALVVVRHRLSTALLHRQARLRTIERLNLAFLVDAEHDCLVGWIEVEPDDVDYFLSEFWIVR